MPTNLTLTIGGDLKVHRLGLGAIRLTGPPVWLDRPAAIDVARRAVELGVTFVDTADSYDLGDNESLLADALHPYPAGVVIATKGGRINVGDQWFDLGRPEYLRQQAEVSRRRLRVERIDLYQLHRIDPTVPLADQLGALGTLRDEGTIRHIGLSEVTLDQLVAARQIAPIAAVQNRYNVLDRRSEAVLEYCERNDIAFIPWRPIAPWRPDDPLDPVAARLGISRTQLALAWLLQRSTAMLPIPGTSSRTHLEENVDAASITLEPDDVELLDQLAEHEYSRAV
jgi:pyridoxine 4-dehydrogenase